MARSEKRDVASLRAKLAPANIPGIVLGMGEGLRNDASQVGEDNKNKQGNNSRAALPALSCPSELIPHAAIIRSALRMYE